jgi:cytoskeletal protein CcmA (bactofilin family)
VASLGPSLVIRGTLSGQEDLVIEGQVEGEISLRKHSVTVGQKGRVKADIFSKSICVEGEVHGNLFGEDQVTIRKSGKVRGNVTSPRVSLEDGSKFKGAIDMNPPPPASPAQEPAQRQPTHREQASRGAKGGSTTKSDERTPQPVEG